VHVASPFDGAVLHTFELTDCGVATSGIGRRSWLDAAGRPAHHLIDPATGRPSRTGFVQATAVAAEAWVAEVLAKDVLLRDGGDPFRTVEAAGAAALTVDRDGRIRASSGLGPFLGSVTLPPHLDALTPNTSPRSMP
jgi:thiamine biosynthesis lipoprotein